MFRNYLKTALRNIIRQKWFSLINIFGLATGMAASVMLFIYISNENSFDNFHENGDKIYRVISQFNGNADDELPRAFQDLGPLMEENSPLVSAYCRMKNESYNIIREDVTIKGVVTLMVDNNFPDFFSFPSRIGDIQKTLSDPSGIVISSELALKLFGDMDPIGQVITYSKTIYDMEQQRWTSRPEPARVGAVLSPMPGNTHLKFDALLSYQAYDPQWTSTFANDVFVFLMVEGKNPDLESISGISKGFFDEMNISLVITNYLQPLKEIHFGPRYGFDIGPRGDMKLIIVFTIVAMFIISIAVINFINLVTAHSGKRAVEACIRKVSGASRVDIFGQFIGESLLMSLISFFLAMVMVELFLSPFSQMLGRELSIDPLESLSIFIKLLGVVLIVGVLAGIYPAIMFSSFQPAVIMRGKLSGGRRNPLLRIILVVIQFAISVILIISITVFNRQVDYMKESDLGFNPEHVLLIGSLTPSLINGYDAIKAELLRNPRILEVGSGQAIPGYPGSGQSIRLAEDPAGHEVSITEYRVRKGFKEAYEIDIIEGDWFDFDDATQQNNYILNQAAVKALGISEPIGKEVIMFNRPGKIIGVTGDFHYSSLRNKIDPLMFTSYSNAFYNIVVKISEDHQKETVEYLRGVLSGFDPNYNFSEYYVGDRFTTFYQAEEQQNTILNYASILAIIIAMLGLLGLSSYIVIARTKEIGIRKIMGASKIQITGVLFGDMVRWVILGNLIAWPFAWYALEQWLSNYPYRISMSIGFLLLAGSITLVIAALTIALHTWKAARANPVDALKS